MGSWHPRKSHKLPVAVRFGLVHPFSAGYVSGNRQQSDTLRGEDSKKKGMTSDHTSHLYRLHGDPGRSDDGILRVCSQGISPELP